MDDFEEELKRDFLTECVDLLESAESAFLRLDEERSNPDLLNEIFRLAHNLKGTSQAVGFTQLGEFTHIAENLILKIKEGDIEINDHIVTVLLEFKDKVTEIIDGLNEDLNASFNLEEMHKQIIDATDNQNAGAEAAKSEDLNVEEIIELDEILDTDDSGATMNFHNIPKPNHLEDIGESVIEENSADNTPSTEAKKEQENDNLINPAALEALKELGICDDSLIQEVQAIADTPVKNEEVIIKAIPEAKKVEPVKKEKSATKANNGDENIRVKLERIDTINNVIGELVILQTVLNQRKFTYIEDDLSNKSISTMGKLFKEVQEIAMSLRMLPMKNTFQKMNRIVRDTSRALNKKVKLHMEGEETDVDKTVLEKIADPLVHIIRNSVDHGLETPEEREAAGKDPVGNVELLAFHEGSNLVIEVSDDGKGINPEIIKKIAIDKGIVNQGDNLSNQEIYLLIFHPGFSTKETVTEVSGRGVGMDVVKTNIEGLGGEVQIQSKLGEGSTFKIILPLTLAIIEGIIIKSEEEKFVIPLTQIFELTTVKTSNIESFTGVADLFELRGEVLPLFHINKKLGNKIKDVNKQVVIIVRGLGQTFGVSVDDVINQQQIVIKKLGEDVRDINGIMGSAIMGDGMPSFILDLFELFKDDVKKSRGHKKLKEQEIAA